MTKQLSPIEWQMLSAYLDGQLSERETRQLESRLQVRSELVAGLEELRRTRALLRALPKRRAPRNFTISAAAAQKIRPTARPRAYPALRLVSAFASFLFVMVLLGDLALGLTTRNLTASAPAEETAPQVVQTTEPEMEAASEAEAPSQKAQASAPAMDASPTQDPNALRSFSAEAEPTPNETEIAAMTAAPSGMGGGVEVVPTDSGALEAAPADATLEAGAPLAEQPVDPAPEASQDRTGVPNDSQAREAGRFDPRTLLRPAEIALAVIALGSALAALWARRASGR